MCPFLNGGTGKADIARKSINKSALSGRELEKHRVIGILLIPFHPGCKPILVRYL